MADTAPPQDEPKPRLPVELCEHVINEVYEYNYYLIPAALATLSSCALVCRAWRAPSQKALFERVVLRDKEALYQLAALLDASPELQEYVRRVQLRGYLHVPNSSVVSFPAVIGARLTNLSEVNILELPDDEKDAYPLPDGVKKLPALPIRRLYLPTIHASISHIRTIVLFSIVFPSFGDFTRILNALSNLRELSCQAVSWIVLGHDPLCMTQRASRGSAQTFLPRLEQFACVDMDERGRQRLLSALGPSFRRLLLKLPNYPKSIHIQPSVKEQDSFGALNLQSLHHLDTLRVNLVPFQEPSGRALESLREMLLSWATSDECELGYRSAFRRHRQLYLEPYRQLFTRREFVWLLRAIGSVVEVALCAAGREYISGDSGDTAGRGGIENQIDPCRATVVVWDLGDRLEWAGWWETRIQECFPTFAKWKRLQVYPDSSVNPTFGKWKDYEETPEDLLPPCCPP